VPTYSRHSPSPRYQKLVALYQQMHREGIPEQNIAADDLYYGGSLIGHLPAIRSLVLSTGARSILDYGSGKGRVYDQRNITLPGEQIIPSIQAYLGVERIACYDPAVPEHSVFPADQFDGVVSTDALEHCPEEDMPWIVEEMFSAARKFIYANVASYPAHKRLPNGENAHATQRSAEWWADLLNRAAAGRPNVVYRFKIGERPARKGLFRQLFSPRKRVTILSNAA